MYLFYIQVLQLLRLVGKRWEMREVTYGKGRDPGFTGGAFGRPKGGRLGFEGELAG